MTTALTCQEAYGREGYLVFTVGFPPVAQVTPYPAFEKTSEKKVLDDLFGATLVTFSLGVHVA